MQQEKDTNSGSFYRRREQEAAIRQLTEQFGVSEAAAQERIAMLEEQRKLSLAYRLQQASQKN